MAAPKDIYELFDQFVDTTMKKNENFFINGEIIFENNTLKKLVELYKNTTDIKKDSFNPKIQPLDESVKKVYAHLMWLQNLPIIIEETSKETRIDDIKKVTGQTVTYAFKGVVNYGSGYYSQPKEIRDLSLLYFSLVNQTQTQKDIKDIKEFIIKWCLDIDGTRNKAYTSSNIQDYPQNPLPLHNMLLHLCKKEYYDDISATGDKDEIVETFRKLLPPNFEKLIPTDFVDNDNGINKKFYSIINEISKRRLPSSEQKKYKYKNLWGDTNAINHSVRIYDYKNIWKQKLDDDDAKRSPINALRFKKAIVLYGPPGTSKTYSAKKMAKTIIYKEQNPKPDITSLFDNSFDKQIHRLQLHPNYTYEDFIWGYQINNKEYRKKDFGPLLCVGNETGAKKGYFLRLLDEMKKDPSKTHVLILDEINRVDLSRLFGELFSAIENRNEPIDLPVAVEGTTSISIPDNLFIIGTMNEIDFSLERVDFALRRRFVWFFHGYKKEVLKMIIEDKIDKLRKDKKQNVLDNLNKNFNSNIQAEYINCCTLLNKAISDDKEIDLGPQYEIGHTFFAELVDIWEDIPEKEIDIVKQILWDISIEPMIKAYLGNRDEDDKNNHVNNLKAIFFK